MWWRTRFISSFVLVLVLGACSSPQDTEFTIQRGQLEVITNEHGVPVATRVEGRTGPGSHYEIWVPTGWNGKRLVLYAHGYIDPATPVGFPKLPPELIALREGLLMEGFAVAYSSYSEHGYALKDGVQRTHQLRGLFNSHFEKPERVYLMGHSLGGMVVLMMAERYSQYDGALSMCGFVGGGQLQVDYIANVRVLFDAFYPDLSAALLPGNAVNVPPGLNFGAISSGIAAGIAAEFAADPIVALLKLLSFATIEQVTLPFEASGLPLDNPTALALWLADPTNLTQAEELAHQIVGSLLGALYYNVVGGHDLLERTRGSAFDNRNTVYTGPLLDAAAQAYLNTTVDRFRSRPNAVNYLRQWYQPSGKPKIPVLTLHTTLDPDVPFRHQAAYATIASAAGGSDMLVQQHVNRYGHCNFTADETFGALGDLVAWVELGLKPEGGDVH